MLTGLQEVAGSIEISVTGKKKLALKKVEEVLETVLSNLELTRVLEIVDIWIKMLSDLPSREIIRFDRCDNNRFKGNCRYCRFNGKVITKAVIIVK